MKEKKGVFQKVISVLALVAGIVVAILLSVLSRKGNGTGQRSEPDSKSGAEGQTDHSLQAVQGAVTELRESDQRLANAVGGLEESNRIAEGLDRKLEESVGKLGGSVNESTETIDEAIRLLERGKV